MAAWWAYGPVWPNGETATYTRSGRTLAQRVEPEATPVHHARPGVLDHEVGRRDEAQEVGPPAVVVEVEHDAALAAVVGVEAQPGERLVLAVGQLAPRAATASPPAARP